MSVLVIGVFVAGSLLGLVLGLRIFRAMKDKAEIFILRGRLKKFESQLASLKMKNSSENKLKGLRSTSRRRKKKRTFLAPKLTSEKKTKGLQIYGERK